MSRRIDAAAVLAVLAALTVVAGALPAGAARNELRSETLTYDNPNGVRLSHLDEQVESVPDVPTSLQFRPRPGERFVRFAFEDAAWGTVFVRIRQPGPRGDLNSYYCGDAGVFKLVSAEPIEMRFYNGLCENHLWGAATRGTVTATYSATDVWRLARPHDH